MLMQCKQLPTTVLSKKGKLFTSDFMHSGMFFVFLKIERKLQYSAQLTEPQYNEL